MADGTTTKHRLSAMNNDTPERSDWIEYECEKRRIQSLNLPPKQYDGAITELTNRLNL